MEAIDRKLIRTKVLDYLGDQTSPVGLKTITNDVRQQINQIRDSEVRDVVQAMIVTGKLKYAAGSKIELQKDAI